MLFCVSPMHMFKIFAISWIIVHVCHIWQKTHITGCKCMDWLQTENLHTTLLCLHLAVLFRV